MAFSLCTFSDSQDRSLGSSFLHYSELQAWAPIHYNQYQWFSNSFTAMVEMGESPPFKFSTIGVTSLLLLGLPVAAPPIAQTVVVTSTMMQSSTTSYNIHIIEGSCYW